MLPRRSVDRYLCYAMPSQGTIYAASAIFGFAREIDSLYNSARDIEIFPTQAFAEYCADGLTTAICATKCLLGALNLLHQRFLVFARENEIFKIKPGTFQFSLLSFLQNVANTVYRQVSVLLNTVSGQYICCISDFWFCTRK